MIFRNNRFSFLTSVSRLTAFLIIASFAFSPPRASCEEPAPIKVGWIGPVTGNAATLGVDSAPAAQLVFDAINAKGGIDGRKIKFLVEDDQYVSAKTLGAYNKLVKNDGVKVLFVLTYGGLFALSPRAQADGVVLIDPLDCDEAIAKLPANVFCVAKTTEDLGYRIAQLVHNANVEPAAVIYYDGDPFMGTVESAMERKTKELGGQVLSKDTYNDGTQEFRAYLTKIRASKAKSLVFMGYDPTGLAMREARQLGIKLPIFAVAGTMQGPGFRSLAQDAANGVIGPVWIAPKTERYAKFQADFEAKVGRKPIMDLSTVPSYDVAELLVHAFENGALEKTVDKKAGAVNVEALKQSLHATKDYDGLSGKITVAEDGATKGLEITDVTYLDGNLLPLNK